MTATREGAAAEAARQVEVSWPASRVERNLARVHERAGRFGRRARPLAFGGAVVFAMAAAVTLLLRLWTPRPADVALAHPVRPAASQASNDPRTNFADGSLARVSEGGELVVKSATPERIESVLTRGTAEFEVTKHAQREFVVLAGPVQVWVVGTRFRVERLGERTRVSVTEGKVEVREGEARSYLEAGESRFFPTRTEQPESAPNAGRARFLELTRGGEFKAAYQVMSQNPGVVGAGAEDLMLAADAARLSNHPEEAAKYLRRVTSEHARDSRAPLAAFTLGRVLLSQLSRPAEAADAFALSRKLRPSGGLSEDALAREAEARAAAGARSRASVLASEYVSRYPHGKHRSTMQRLATAP